MFKVAMVAMTHIHNISQHWGFQKIQPGDIFINSDFLQQLHQQGAISGDRSGSVPLTDDVHGDRTSCGCSQWGSGSHPGDRKSWIGSPTFGGTENGVHFPYENGTFPYENVENVDIHRENMGK